MGFMRKALFLGTGGLSGMAGVRANSKKERTAKAAEKQVRLQKQMLSGSQQTTTAHVHPVSTTARAAKTEEATFTRCSVVQLHAAAVRTVSEMGYSAIDASGRDTGIVSFRTGMSMRSMGQLMTARVFPGADGAKVVVGGQPRNRQLYDWGEAQKIARKFLARLGETVDTAPESADTKIVSAQARSFPSAPPPVEVGVSHALDEQDASGSTSGATPNEPHASTNMGIGSTAGEIERLAQLHAQGVLSDAEFAAAKAKVLGT